MFYFIKLVMFLKLLNVMVVMLQQRSPLLISTQIRFLVVPDLLQPQPARSGPETQDVAVFSAGNDPICCGTPLSRYRPLTTGNAHFACSVTVVHFLKRLYYGKVGSNRNGRPVI